MNATPAVSMKVSELRFDIKNPRLAEYNLNPASSDADVIRILWDDMDVKELVLSIAASGYFPHEPVIVSNENEKYVVIEGNRRLAACKVILDSELALDLKANVPEITDDAKAALQEIPAVVDTRVNAWRYLGFKHVNGPAKWSSYAKAQYIASVHRNYGITLEDIAAQIGDTHKTVQRLFRGLMVIEQAEKMKVFDRDDRWNRHFASSHLYTGLDYPGISSFISLSPEVNEKSQPVPAEKKEELRELFLWLYGSKRQDTRPVIQSQNPDLRRLDAVLASRESVAALRAGRELTYSFEISRPSSNVFEESLYAAKRDLEKARSMLSTGYDGSNVLLGIARDVAELSYDLYEEMERKKNPRPRRPTSGKA